MKNKEDKEMILVPKKFTKIIDHMRIDAGVKKRVDYLDNMANDLEREYVKRKGNKPFFDTEWR